MSESKESKNKEEVEDTRTGSVIILESLIAENVNVIFGYPGGAIMPTYDSLYDYSEQINHILVRHEQGAIHAAQGYARASGDVGVVLVTSGPAATNLVTGLADAMVDSTPLVCITGQVYAHLLGSDAFQETDIINITSPITKWNYQITDANEIPSVLAKAFYIARSGRPGPVLVDITKNAQLQSIKYSGHKKCHEIRSYRPSHFDPIERAANVKKTADLINKSKQPLVVFGQGILLGHAETEFKLFLEKGNLPAASTILGLSAMPSEHPLFMGMLGMHGNYGPNVLTNECDLLIAIGMRFDDRVTGKIDSYAKQAKIIHIDIDQSEINKNIKCHLGFLGNCKELLPLITEQLIYKECRPWIERFHECMKIERMAIIDKELHPKGNELTMGEVVNHLNEFTKGEAIIVSDVGQHQMIACRYSVFKKARSNITSGGLGTMGFALPAAVGAKKGAPDRLVVAIAGDGGMQMNIQELGTVMQSKIDIKILVLNNRFLGMVRQWQQLFHDKRYSYVEIESPDFVQVAKAYNIPGERISSREDLSSSIERMINHRGAYLLEVIVAQENNVFPMVPQGCSVSEMRLS